MRVSGRRRKEAAAAFMGLLTTMYVVGRADNVWTDRPLRLSSKVVPDTDNTEAH